MAQVIEEKKAVNVFHIRRADAKFAENDLSGKTIVPFGIHLGSRFGKMIEQMKGLEPGATVTDGFTINAETDNDEVKTGFGEWLDALSFLPR